jgi:hypothetical protein
MVLDRPVLEAEMRALGGAAAAAHDPQGRSQAQHALA